MKKWLHAAFAAAVIAAAATPAFARGMAGGVANGAHGFGVFSSRPLYFGVPPFAFRSAFPQARFGQARFEGWSGGAYSADVAASEDEGIDPDNIHFRVQEPFGPGDLGRPMPEQTAGADAWEDPRPLPAYANGPGEFENR